MNTSTNIIFLNGKFMPIHKAVVSVSDPGFTYGWGVFETMRSIDGEIVYLDEHLNRLYSSCRLLDIALSYTCKELKDIINGVVVKNKIHDARVRLSAWKKSKGAGVLAVAQKYQPLSKEKYRDGICVCVSALRQNEASFLTRVKSMNRLFYELCFEQAKESGCDEALILNTRGYLAECSRANIFLVKDGELFTPALNNGCLAGITRMAVMDVAEKCNIEVFESDITVADIKNADGVFITNSLLGIMPVAFLGKQKVTRRAGRQIIDFLSGEYARLCNLRQ